MSEWQPIATAPRDGTQILAHLSNGWMITMHADPTWDTYAWWKTGSHLSVPVEETHAPGSITGLRATHWMPMPRPPVSPQNGPEQA